MAVSRRHASQNRVELAGPDRPWRPATMVRVRRAMPGVLQRQRASPGVPRLPRPFDSETECSARCPDRLPFAASAARGPVNGEMTFKRPGMHIPLIQNPTDKPPAHRISLVLGCRFASTFGGAGKRIAVRRGLYEVRLERR